MEQPMDRRTGQPSETGAVKGPVVRRTPCWSFASCVGSDQRLGGRSWTLEVRKLSSRSELRKCPSLRPVQSENVAGHTVFTTRSVKSVCPRAPSCSGSPANRNRDVHQDGESVPRPGGRGGARRAGLVGGRLLVSDLVGWGDGRRGSGLAEGAAGGGCDAAGTREARLWHAAG
jgi:hypothetical protein